MIKRLIIWIFETVLEVVLLGVMLAILLGHDQNAFAKDVFINGSGILLMFFATGYLLTTIIVRALWKVKACGNTRVSQWRFTSSISRS